jgi:NAD-dependent dihydropyrimidine dehydrogenase PreA subunit
MAVRKIVEIIEELCDGCGQCVLSCAEGAIEVIDGKAKLVKDSYCDGLGACLGECPQGALKIIERDADEFDPEAVEEFLKEKEQHEKAAKEPQPMPCGCPSSNIQMFDSAGAEASRPALRQQNASALTHWPVQVRLVPAKAPFLTSAHLLVAADCTPVAYPDFHCDFVQGRAVLLGCPKLDNTAEYVQKFAEIFKAANIQSVTVLDMEVPCCAALTAIVKKGMEASGKTIPLEEVTVSVRGEIIKRVQSAA